MGAKLLSKRALVAAIIVSCGLTVARSASAEERPRVVWSAPASCPSAEQVTVLVDRAVGHEWPSDVDAIAAVTSSESGRFKVEIVITVRGVAGARTMEAWSCARLANATALVIATAADSAAMKESAPPNGLATKHEGSEKPRAAELDVRPRAAPIAASGPEAGAPPPPDASPGRAPSSGGHLRAGAHTFGIAGVFPAANVGTGPNVSLVFRELWFDAAFVYWFEQTIHRGPRLRSGADLELASVQLRVCRHLLDVPPELGACVGASGGTFMGRGFGLRNADRTVQPWAVVTAGLDVRRHVSRGLSWSTGVDVGISVVRPSFAIDDYGVTAQAAWIFGQLKAGVELDFF